MSTHWHWHTPDSTYSELKLRKTGWNGSSESRSDTLLNGGVMCSTGQAERALHGRSTQRLSV